MFDRSFVVARAWLTTTLLLALTACLPASAADRPKRLSKLDDAILRAAELDRTAEGKAYRRATDPYVSALTGVIMGCTQTERHTRVSLDIVLIISADGWIKNVLCQNATTAACFARATSAVRLPRPPKPDWPIHVGIAVESS
jgi:hypothetical protein